MHLEVEPALDLLAQIFPVTEEEEEPLDFGETATYRSAGGQSYLPSTRPSSARSRATTS